MIFCVDFRKAQVLFQARARYAQAVKVEPGVNQTLIMQPSSAPDSCLSELLLHSHF